MFVVCFNSKYGFCQYGKTCDKIHFTDICENSQACQERYYDKRHPVRCYYFDRYNKYKFGHFCSYFHAETKEQKLEKMVSKLKIEISDLKLKNIDLQEKINKMTERKVVHVKDGGVTDDSNMDLQTLIQQNSFYNCDKCEYK